MVWRSRWVKVYKQDTGWVGGSKGSGDYTTLLRVEDSFYIMPTAKLLTLQGHALFRHVGHVHSLRNSACSSLASTRFHLGAHVGNNYSSDPVLGIAQDIPDRMTVFRQM